MNITRADSPDHDTAAPALGRPRLGGGFRRTLTVVRTAWLGVSTAAGELRLVRRHRRTAPALPAPHEEATAYVQPPTRVVAPRDRTKNLANAPRPIVEVGWPAGRRMRLSLVLVALVTAVLAVGVTESASRPAADGVTAAAAAVQPQLLHVETLTTLPMPLNNLPCVHGRVVTRRGLPKLYVPHRSPRNAERGDALAHW